MALLGIRRAHAGQQLQRAKGRHLIARIVDPAQHRQQVLDVCRLKEAQAAIFHERNLPPGQLDLQQVAVAAAAEQHRLAMQGDMGLAPSQHFAADRLGLRRQIIHRDQPRALTLTADGQEVLAELSRRVGHECVRGIQDLLGGTIVLRQGDDLGTRLELVRKIQDVVDGCGAERIDRLRVIADHRQATAVRAQRLQDLRLQRIGVLILIHQHMVEVGR